MSRKLCFMFLAVFPLSMLGGCSSTASQSSPESVRDPLGIDRAIDDYYFPNGVPKNDGTFDSGDTDVSTTDSVDAPELDNRP